MNKLKHIDHGRYVLDKIIYREYDCVNPNVKRKEYTESDWNSDDILNNPKYSYSNVYYDSNPFVYVTTPKMTCVFGLDRRSNIMNLQFTDYKTNPHMKSFFEFIRNLEFQQMMYLGLDDSNSDVYTSQIRYSKDDKYDPTLVVKLPFIYNKYDVDIYHDDFPISILNIQRFSRMTCDIYIDKIWRFNGRYICKWKAKQIYVHT